MNGQRKQQIVICKSGNQGGSEKKIICVSFLLMQEQMIEQMICQHPRLCECGGNHRESSRTLFWKHSALNCFQKVFGVFVGVLRRSVTFSLLLRKRTVDFKPHAICKLPLSNYPKDESWTQCLEDDGVSQTKWLAVCTTKPLCVFHTQWNEDSFLGTNRLSYLSRNTAGHILCCVDAKTWSLL